jgi:hypothetical protein
VLALFLALTLFSFLLIVVGFIWVVTTSGETRHDSGEKVGAQIIGEQIGDDDSSVVQRTTFKGKAILVEHESSFRFTEIKARISAGDYSEALPIVLASGGLLGMLTFGSLALFVGMENKVGGGMIALVAIFTALRVVVKIVRD